MSPASPLQASPVTPQLAASPVTPASPAASPSEPGAGSLGGGAPPLRREELAPELPPSEAPRPAAAAPRSPAASAPYEAARSAWAAAAAAPYEAPRRPAAAPDEAPRRPAASAPCEGAAAASAPPGAPPRSPPRSEAGGGGAGLRATAEPWHVPGTSLSRSDVARWAADLGVSRRQAERLLGVHRPKR